MDRVNLPRTIIFLTILFFLAGEIWFVFSTREELAFLRAELISTEKKNTLQNTLVREMKSDMEALSRRVGDIEAAASVAIAGFKDSLAKAETDRKKLEMALAVEQRARELAELSRQAEGLRSSVEIVALRNDLSSSISATDLSRIVETWRPRIARIECRIGGVGTSVGSGVLMRFADTSADSVAVLTNRHVLYGGSDLIPPTSCDVSLPNNGARATALASQKEIQVDKDGSLDFGRLVVSNPPGSFLAVVKTEAKKCIATPKQGNALLILGYPSIGATGDITATDGIISGFEQNYYITSAKVERGNSGGAAILVKDNCLLGIPTFVKKGGIESLARILDIRAVK